MLKMDSEKVWVNFSSKLKNFLLKRLGDNDVANDLLQEVFLKIHLNVSKLKDETKLENWVFQIAYNQLKDYYRKNKQEQIELLEANEVVDEAMSDDHSPVDCLIPFIDSLPEKYKLAIRLSAVDGLKQSEIAQKLGVSLSGAKSRVQRGREMIKQHFIDCCNYHIREDGKLIGEHNHNHESWNCNDNDCLVHS